MRIIAGIAKRRPIIAPKGDNTRPTQDYIRESLFNIIQAEVSESICLDLFAGSGALGLEALSRGASSCLFCDKNHKAIAAVKDNIRTLGFTENTQVIKADSMQALAMAQETGQHFDLVFIDPPYAYQEIPAIFETLHPLLKENALVVLERDKHSLLPHLPGYALNDRREYGITTIYLLRKEQS